MNAWSVDVENMLVQRTRPFCKKSRRYPRRENTASRNSWDFAVHIYQKSVAIQDKEKGVDWGKNKAGEEGRDLLQSHHSFFLLDDKVFHSLEVATHSIDRFLGDATPLPL